MSIQKQFEQIGGHFINSAHEISVKLKDIHAFIFDWDGVFNNGQKSNPDGSPFSEADSMGINMLRFSYWLKHNKLPFVAIVTGENNLTAKNFAKREHLNAVLLKTKNKSEAIKKLADINGFSLDQTAFIFDDILDLSTAEICKLNFCIKRSASPLFGEFVLTNGLCAYISANQGGENAVREITELLIGLNGNFDETVKKRMEYKNDYENYILLRNGIEPKF